MAHPVLHLDEAPEVDRQRSERVAQVMEAECSQARSLARELVAAPQGRAVCVPSALPREHRIVRAGEAPALAQLGETSENDRLVVHAAFSVLMTFLRRRALHQVTAA